MQNAVADYENTKATCTEYPLEQITHVFFHTLIKTPRKLLTESRILTDISVYDNN